MKTKKVGRYDIPVDQHGNVYNQFDFRLFKNGVYSNSRKNVTITPRKNKAFFAKLQISRIRTDIWYKKSTFCQSTNVDNDELYPMFMGDLLEVISRSDVINGTVEGIWAFLKKGGNFGVTLILSKKEIEKIEETMGHDIEEIVERINNRR